MPMNERGALRQFQHAIFSYYPDPFGLGLEAVHD